MERPGDANENHENENLPDEGRTLSIDAFIQRLGFDKDTEGKTHLLAKPPYYTNIRFRGDSKTPAVLTVSSYAILVLP